MKLSTTEWIESAEKDWDLVLRLSRVRTRTHYDHTCFRAKLCVEKYLEAKLIEANLKFIATEDLTVFLAQAARVEPSLASLQAQAEFLNQFDLHYCYPGHDATKAQAKQAIKDCRVMRNAIRTAFGLPF